MLHAIPHLEGLDRCLPATRTTRPDFARSYLGQIFADHRLLLKAGSIDFVHRHTNLCEASIGLLRYGSDVEVVAPALDFYLLQFTVSGEIAVRSAQFDLTLRPGSVFVMNPGVAYRKRWTRDAQQLIVKIPRPLLEHRLAESSGGNARASICFANRAFPFNDTTRPLLRLIDYICRDLSDDAGLLRDVRMRRDLEGALLGALLATVPHEDRRRPPDDARYAVPHYVRRAENYLRDNAFRAVRMPELTNFTGVSERTLQDGFLKFRRQTPGRYARALRLDLVHRALLDAPAPDGAVTRIALRFGFTHLGRFSRSYADRFGEYPSDTVRRKTRP